MNTLSDEESFSGNYSSKVDKENNISIVLRKRFNTIPDSLKNEVIISLNAFQKSLNNNSKLMIQTEGGNAADTLIEIPLASQINENNQWKNFNYLLTIPEKMKSADIIKVYVYNPSTDAVYVDDFKIVFN